MTTVQELYETIVRARPTAERLQLAAMILNDIAPEAIVVASEQWSDEDVREFRKASSYYMLTQLEDAEDG
ncbi:MAG TPA: hypothetical protein VKT77_11660 [Chthonomonadaceae bacterium]|nr:hypothetical protein [Chthonomonadaceae bacterium]